MKRFAGIVGLIGIFWLSVLTGGCAVPYGPPGEGESGPYLVTMAPASGAYGVSPYASVEMRFSQEMDTTLISGFEILAKGLLVEGGLRWVDPLTLSFRPSKSFEAGVSYQCVLRDGMSKEGVPLVGVPYVWVFTVGVP